MKIVDVKTQTFRYKTTHTHDSEGHGHYGPEHDATQTLLTIVTDEGAEGYAFGVNPALVEHVFKPALLGEDPLYREKIWQRFQVWQRLHRDLIDNELCQIDLALWDLAGRYLQQPVYKLLGGFRDKVLAYASTGCGDADLPGGLNTPDDYGAYAKLCVQRGYKAIKLHTWMPPIPWAPDPKMDVKACAAVREAVGDDIPLMLDCYHHYSREQALYIGRQLEKLNFYWLEEPMDEHSISSYVWLAQQLNIPVLAPEAAEGKLKTRAEWIVRGACDILRAGVNHVGGITPLIKIVHLAEAFGLALEIHGGGPGNLHVLGAMGIPGEFLERGVHPLVGFDDTEPWLHERIDVMDDQGFVAIPQRPGLGEAINFDYIEENTIKTEGNLRLHRQK